jgi:hypothetical protein
MTIAPVLDYMPEERELHLVNFPDYWKHPMHPRNFADFVDMIDTQGKILGIWELTQWNPKTGKITKREWTKNTVTDNGAVNILGSAIAAASNSSQWNNLYINNNSGSTTLTTALTNGQTAVTSLAVAAIPAAVPLDYPAPIASTVTQLTVGYGSGQTQTVSMNAAASQSATSLTTVSYTSNAAYAIGTAVVPLPNVGENPSNANLKANQSSVVEQYSGNLSSGAFTYNNTTGAGNRNVVVTFVFKTSANGGSTAIGNYTDCWLVNVSSSASNATSGIFVGNYIDHLINTPMRVDNSNNVTATCTIKL